MTLLFLFGVSMIGMKTYVHFLLIPMLLGVVDVLVVPIVVALVALVIDVFVLKKAYSKGVGKFIKIDHIV
jgi:hypothetical protein